MTHRRGKSGDPDSFPNPVRLHSLAAEQSSLVDIRAARKNARMVRSQMAFLEMIRGRSAPWPLSHSPSAKQLVGGAPEYDTVSQATSAALRTADTDAHVSPNCLLVVVGQRDIGRDQDGLPPRRPAPGHGRNGFRQQLPRSPSRPSRPATHWYFQRITTACWSAFASRLSRR
jgi:hypothetical protein